LDSGKQNKIFMWRAGL